MAYVFLISPIGDSCKNTQSFHLCFGKNSVYKDAWTVHVYRVASVTMIICSPPSHFCFNTESVRLPSQPGDWRRAVISSTGHWQHYNRSDACVQQTATRISNTNQNYLKVMGHLTLAAITGTIIMVSNLLVKPPPPIWRSVTRRWNLSGNDLTMTRGYQDILAYWWPDTTSSNIFADISSLFWLRFSWISSAVSSSGSYLH